MEGVKESLPPNYVTLAQLQQRWKEQQSQPQHAICNNNNPHNYLTLAQLRERRNQQQQNDSHNQNQLDDDANQIEANCPREEKENGNGVVQRTVAVVDGGRRSNVEKGKEKVGEENAGTDKKITHTGRNYSRSKNRIYKGDSSRHDVVQGPSSNGNDTVSAVEGIPESENDVKKKKVSSGEIRQNDAIQVAFSQGNCAAVECNCESEISVKKKTKYLYRKQRKNAAKEKLIKGEDQRRAGGEKENEKLSVPEVQVPLSAIEEKSEIVVVKDGEVHAPVIKRGKEKVNVVYKALMNVESKTVEVEACGKHNPIIGRGSDKFKTKRGNHKTNGIERPPHAPHVERGMRYEIKNDLRRIGSRPKSAVEEATEVVAVETIQEEAKEMAAVETLAKEDREMVSADITIEEARGVASVETVHEEVREMASFETLEKEDREMVSVEITIEEARDVASVETIEKRIGGVLIEEESNEGSEMTVDDNSNSNSNSSVNKDYNRSVGCRRDSQYRGYRYTYDRFQNRKNFDYKGYGYNGVSRNNGYRRGGARRWAADTRGMVWVKKEVVADVGEGTGA